MSLVEQENIKDIKHGFEYWINAIQTKKRLNYTFHIVITTDVLFKKQK
jgi:hypothetical protein